MLTLCVIQELLVAFVADRIGLTLFLVVWWASHHC